MDPLPLKRDVERKQQELWEQLLFKLHAVVKKEAIKFVEFCCGLNANDLQQSSKEHVEKQMAQVVAMSRTIVKICKETCEVFVSLSQKESERLGLPLDDVKTRKQQIFIGKKRDIEDLTKAMGVAVVRLAGHLKAIHAPGQDQSTFPIKFAEYRHALLQKIKELVNYLAAPSESLFDEEEEAAEDEQHPQQRTQLADSGGGGGGRENVNKGGWSDGKVSVAAAVGAGGGGITHTAAPATTMTIGLSVVGAKANPQQQTSPRGGTNNNNKAAGGGGGWTSPQPQQGGGKAEVGVVSPITPVTIGGGAAKPPTNNTPTSPAITIPESLQGAASPSSTAQDNNASQWPNKLTFDNNFCGECGAPISVTARESIRLEDLVCEVCGHSLMQDEANRIELEAEKKRRDDMRQKMEQQEQENKMKKKMEKMAEKALEPSKPTNNNLTNKHATVALSKTTTATTPKTNTSGTPHLGQTHAGWSKSPTDNTTTTGATKTPSATPLGRTISVPALISGRGAAAKPPQPVDKEKSSNVDEHRKERDTLHSRLVRKTSRYWCSVCGTPLGSPTQKFCGICGITFDNGNYIQSTKPAAIRQSEWKKKKYDPTTVLPSTPEEIENYKKMMREKYERQKSERIIATPGTPPKKDPTTTVFMPYVDSDNKGLVITDTTHAGGGGDVGHTEGHDEGTPRQYIEEGGGAEEPEEPEAQEEQGVDEEQQRGSYDEHDDEHGNVGRASGEGEGPLEENGEEVAAEVIEGGEDDGSGGDQQVAKILTQLDLGKYVPLFCEQEEITYEAFLLLTNEDLIHMGIPTGPRKIILAVVQELGKQ